MFAKVGNIFDKYQINYQEVAKDFLILTQSDNFSPKLVTLFFTQTYWSPWT